MKKPEDKKTAVTLDLKLEDIPRESLIGLVRLYSRLMMDIDGFWFLSMKDRAGNEEAIACDNWVWGKVVKKMLRRSSRADRGRRQRRRGLHDSDTSDAAAPRCRGEDGSPVSQPGHTHCHPLPNTGSAGERRCREGCPALQAGMLCHTGQTRQAVQSGDRGQMPDHASEKRQAGDFLSLGVQDRRKHPATHK